MSKINTLRLIIIITISISGAPSSNAQSFDLGADDYIADTDYVQMEFEKKRQIDSLHSLYFSTIYNTTPIHRYFALRIDTIPKVDFYIEGQHIFPFTSNGAYDYYVFNIPSGDSLYLEVVTDHAIRKQEFRFFNHEYIPDTLTYLIGSKSYLSYWMLVMMIGFLIVSGIVSTGVSAYTKRVDLLYYGLYLLIGGLWFYWSYFMTPIINDIHGLWSTKTALVKDLMQPLWHIYYLLFLRHFLSSKEKYPFFDKVVRYFLFTVWTSFILIFLAYQIKASFAFKLFDVYRVLSILISIYLIRWMIKNKKDSSVRFIIYGAISLLLFSSLAMIFTWSGINIPLVGPLALTLFGLVVEVVFFNTAIAEKTNHIDEQNLKLEKAYSSQLLANEKQLHEYQRNLIEEINNLKLKLKKEEEANIKTIIEHKDKENEFNLLRTQMDPHFVFNTLNSLKSYIITNNKKEAIDHLDQISKLMRSMLHSVEKNDQTLRDALEHARLYISLENKRLKDPIKLNIAISQGLDIDYERIPTLIIQPFIENAIWHGLAPSLSTVKTITIKVIKKNDYLKIFIKDNGIGRSAAGQKQNLSGTNNALATKINSRRLQIFNEGREGLEINDLIDENGKSAGTEVILTILSKD